MLQILSAGGFLQSDAKLKEDKHIHALHAQYSQLASEGSLAKTLDALQTNGHTAVVVDSKEGWLLSVCLARALIVRVRLFYDGAAALTYLTELAPEGSSIWAGGSTTVIPVRQPHSKLTPCVCSLLSRCSCCKSVSWTI
jgi:hypothetical protein